MINSNTSTTKVNTPLRAALYTRVSSQEQAQHGVSLAEQQERLEYWAKAEGWEVFRGYNDEGYSGGTDDRPALKDLLLDAQAHRFDVLAVTKIDRLFRNNRLLLNTIHQLEGLGIKFVAQAEGIDTSKPGIGKVILNLLGGVAEWERERIGERVRDFRTHLAHKGQWSSGRTPFGTRYNKVNKTLEVYEPEAKTVRAIFEKYALGNIGIVRVAEWCNSEGFETPRAGRRRHDTWTQSAVRHILAHPAYKGSEGGPGADWQFKCPAIVEPELWHQVQKRLAGNRHFREAASETSPLQGLLKCGLCGHTLRTGYNHTTTKVWECPGRLKREHLDGSARCTLPRFKSTEFETLVEKKIASVRFDPSEFKKTIRATIADLENELKRFDECMKPLAAEVANYNEELAIIDARFEMHRIDAATYKTRVAKLQSKIRALEQQQLAADPWHSFEKQREKDLRQYDIDQFKDLLDYFEKLESEFRGYAKTSPYLTVDNFLQNEAARWIKKVIPYDWKMVAKQPLNSGEWLRATNSVLWVFPDRVELKAAVTLRQSNIPSGCRSTRCPQSR